MAKRLELHSRGLIPRALAVFSVFCAVAFPQTVRGKAEERFSAFGWAEKPGEEGSSGGTSSFSIRRLQLSLTDDSEEGTSFDQDSSSFPAAPLAALMAGRALPPILSGAGSLDFSAAPFELTELFKSIASCFKEKSFAEIKAASTSPFLPVMLRHMTRRLPEPQAVWFAQVELAPDGRSARATFKMEFEPSSAEPVFALAEAAFEDGEWRAVDVIFEGDSYEKAAKPPGM